MSLEAADSSSLPYASPGKARGRTYLFGPVVDFLCLGGLSLLVLPFLALLPATYDLQVNTVMLVLANFINHPHFAHSYQIFYRDFRSKAFSGELGAVMRSRYIFAGLVVPALLIAFFIYAITAGDSRLLGQGGNIMALFVGWHYVKQGYGILMLDAALKRKYFRDPAKKILLVNSYAVWIAAWLSANAYITSQKVAGLEHFTFGFPHPLVLTAQIAAAATSIAALWVLVMHWRSSGVLLVNGIVAYGASLYAWLLFVRQHPLWILVVPALHSLQYLVVVWRFEVNMEGAEHADDAATRSNEGTPLRKSLAVRLGLFATGGLALGFLGFWGLPMLLDIYVPYDRQLFGDMLFIFVSWVFINVHHYFIDNVIWRRDNPETKRFLFS